MSALLLAALLCQPASAARAQVGASPDVAAGGGRLSVLYQEPREPRYRPWKEALERRGALREEADRLSDAFLLPRSVSVVFAECGRSDAAYEAEAGRVTLCYEFIDAAAADFAERLGYRPADRDKAVRALLAERAAPRGASGDALTMPGDAPETAWRKSLYGAVPLAFYHGVGHALLDLYAPAPAGREEDAARQLAALLLVEQDMGDAASALDAAALLGRLERAERRRLYFLEEHPFDEEDASDAACWVYGRDPEGWEALVATGMLAARRAPGCRRDFLGVARRWNAWLFPHARDPRALAGTEEPPRRSKPAPAPVPLTAAGAEQMLVVVDTMRSKLTLYYADHGGRYPARIEELVAGGYVPAIPAVVTGRHPPSSAVDDLCGLDEHPERASDAGGWAYCGDRRAKDYGALRVDCAHLGPRGRPWVSY